MTATAGEEPSNSGAPPYPDQAELMRCARQLFATLGGTVTAERDLKGRPYVQLVLFDASISLFSIALEVATMLGIGEIEIKDEVLADLWDELRIDEFDDEERVYLADSVYLNKDGTISQG